MEDWKLQSEINAFTDACSGDSSELIKATKRMSRINDQLRKPEQRQMVLEQLIPLMDDARHAVRQCAGCVVMGVKVEKFSTLPDERVFELYNGEGLVCFSREWKNKVPQSEQQLAWMEFVAGHQVARGRYE